MTIPEALAITNLPTERRLREAMQAHAGPCTWGERTRDGAMTPTGESIVRALAEVPCRSSADLCGSSGGTDSQMCGPVGEPPAFPRMDAEARRLWEAQEQNQARIIFLETENERLQEVARKTYLVLEEYDARLAAVERRTPVRGTSSPLIVYIKRAVKWCGQNFGGRGSVPAVRGPVVFDGVSESMAGGRRH